MPVDPPSEEGLLDERAAAAYSTTVFVFFEHRGTVAHSFYAIEIPNPLPCPKFPPLKKPLSPILEFPADKYARDMRCAKLGSKFYFVGGEREVGIFPSDVYLFDPAPIVFSDSAPPSWNQKKLLQAVPRMTTGKPTPCVFVAYGKLYVLGSTIFDSDFSWKNKSIKFFEVFDPSTSKWTVLDDPQDMLICPIMWLNSVVVGRKVLISGKYHLDGFPVQLTFNLDSHSWNKSEKVRFGFLHRAELVENDTFYGGNRRMGKLGPFTQEELQEEENLFSRRISAIDMPEDMKMKTYTLYNPPGLDDSLSLCHIGNRQFCFVHTGSLWHGVSDFHNFPDINEHLRIIRITILQDTCKSEALFNAKHLYTAEYEVETSFSNKGHICDCYALTPEDKEKLMKKQTRKEKKINKAKKKRVDRDKEKGCSGSTSEQKQLII